MPDARFRQFFARHGWLVAIAAVYLYVFPYFPRIHSANELPRAYLVKAIVVDHSFAVDREVAQWGRTYDLAEYDHRLYQNKAPGASLVVAPVYALVSLFGEPSLGETMWLCRIVSGVIPSLVFLWLLWGFLERFTPDPAVRRLVLVAYAVGSMAMTYSLLYYSHQLSAVCIAGAWILATDVAEKRRGLVAMAIAGLLAGMAPLVDYEAAFAGIPIAVCVLWKLRTWPRARAAKAIAIAAVAAAVPIAMLLYYHTACFGSPLHTGYHFSTDHEHVHGFLGMTHPMWRAFVGTMVAPDNGFVALAPWWLLAIPGGVALWRRGDRATVTTIVAVTIIYVAFVSSLGFWRAGWEIGPRYITVMQPFLIPLVAVTLERWRDRPVRIGVAAGAILVGVAIYTLTSATFPYWPDSLRDPLYEVTFRLLGDGGAAPSVGSAAGISGIAGIVPMLVTVAVLVGWAIASVAKRRGLAIGVAVAIAVLGAFALVPHGGPNADRAYRQTLYPAVRQ